MSVSNFTLQIRAQLDQLDRRLVRFMSAHGITLLRWALAIV